MSVSLILTQAGVLLEGEVEEEDKYDSDSKSDVDSLSDILEFVPSQTSRLLSHNFDKQLQLGDVFMAGDLLTTQETGDEVNNILDECGENRSQSGPASVEEREEKNMQTDEEVDKEEEGGRGNGDRTDSTVKLEPLISTEEDMSVSEVSENRNKSKQPPDSKSCEQDLGFGVLQSKTGAESEERIDHQDSTDADSGRPDSREDEKQGERSPVSSEDDGKVEKDSGVEEYASMLWETMQRGVKEKEKEIMSELSSGSCLMDSDIIV